MKKKTAAIALVLDGNVLDHLLQEPRRLRSLLQAQSEGRVRLIGTHILCDELDRMTDHVKYASLEKVRNALQFEHVPTSGFVFNVSKFNQASWGTNPGIYDNLTVGNPKNAEDALLTLTARTQNATLVTQDGRCRKRANRSGVPAISAPDLDSYTRNWIRHHTLGRET